MTVTAQYELSIDSATLTLKTAYYKAEKGSMLHSGIFNREMSSALASSALTGALLIALATGAGLGVLHLILAVALFTGGFVFFRKAVFKENRLVATVSKADNTVTIKYPGLLPGKTESFGLDSVERLLKDFISIPPENVDGIKVVEKIALQHGTVIPGFGDVLELHSVSFVLKDGTRKIIFSGTDAAAADNLYVRLSEFTGLA